MLQNLYLLHDPTFDEELRRAAIYITDRKTIFNLVEAGHYKIHSRNSIHASSETENEAPADNPEPTPADAAVDYVAYLPETEEEKPESG